MERLEHAREGLLNHQATPPKEDDIRIGIKELTKRLQKAHLDGSIREEHHATPSPQDQNVYS
ncbi:hypothetical protein PROFUN_04303 [Planoprotostelium fungivorum]|uniref:Uncharacterized protein n=1 Tax=Planoprotostelium fungivorum TaxID=1890364 RepID=A0A2P6NV38_9EUKA|nr:hypothetical protein PROFUN_04303 [Planoprotostelium fungivorum]